MAIALAQPSQKSQDTFASTQSGEGTEKAPKKQHFFWCLVEGASLYNADLERDRFPVGNGKIYGAPHFSITLAIVVKAYNKLVNFLVVSLFLWRYRYFYSDTAIFISQQKLGSTQTWVLLLCANKEMYLILEP